MAAKYTSGRASLADIQAAATQFSTDASSNATNAKLAPRGIFGEYPGFTPKYALNAGVDRPQFRETLARLFVPLSPGEEKRFRGSFPSTADVTRRIAGVLTGNGYIEFLLQSAQHGLQEKVDVVEVMTDNYVAYYYGQSAPTFNYSGILVNTYQDDQMLKFLHMYRDIIRGTQLARRQKLVYLRYSGMIVGGTVQNFSWVLNSDNEMAVPFSFSILVKSLTALPNPDQTMVTTETDVESQQFLREQEVSGVIETATPVRVVAAPAQRTVGAAPPPTTSKEKNEEEGRAVTRALERDGEITLGQRWADFKDVSAAVIAEENDKFLKFIGVRED